MTDNGLLELLHALSISRPQQGGAPVFDAMHRPELARRYAWAIPNDEAIHAIAEVAAGRGIVEVGAGTGYWAALLMQAGVDVIATDVAPPEPDGGKEHNVWHAEAETWVEVHRVDAVEAAANCGDRVLFLCWPPQINEMAADAVRAYTGDTVVYVGEWTNGVTATPAFRELIDADWELVRTVEIPVWWGRDDMVRVFTRLAKT